MRKLCMVLAAVAIGLLGFGLTGCQNTGTTEVEAAKPAAQPGQQKPKDHPAH